MICGMVKKCGSLADVGCDHAYASIYIAENGLSDMVYAMDLREGPLERARENVSESGLDAKIKLILSDGLKSLDENPECILISGMGGILICKILEESREKILAADRLLLSPHSDHDLVRRKIHEMGFEIVDEADCFDEGKYYQCIAAERRNGVLDEYSDAEYEFGPVLLNRKSPELQKYLSDRLEKLSCIRTKISGNNGVVPVELNNDIEKITKALEYMAK